MTDSTETTAPKEMRDCPRMSEDDIKETVTKLIQERLVVASMIPDGMVTSVFPLIALGGLSDIKPETIGNVVEDLDKAGPRSVNGYPMFFSCRVIHVDDWKDIIERFTKVHDAMTEAMKDE